MLSGVMEPVANVPAPKKRILVVSVDYDGCFGGAQFIQAFQAIQSLKETDYAGYCAAYREIIMSIHQPLLTKILAKSDGCTEIQIMIGSNRQTLELDSDNNHKNNNGSCFEGMTQLANTVRDLVLIPVKADLRVYGDALMGKPGGHHAQVSFKQSEMGEVTAEAIEKIKTYKSHIGDHKYCLSFLQVMTTCLSNPDSEVIYLFFDDVQKILNESKQQFGVANVANSLPRNLLSTTFSRYMDSTILSDLVVLEGKIKKRENVNTNATKDDINLVLRVARVCPSLANAINAYLSNDKLQAALSIMENKSNDLSTDILELKNTIAIDQVKKDIVIDLSKDVELLQLEKELSVFAKQCIYCDKKEYTLFIEK